MARPKRVTRSVEKNISLPEDLVLRVDLLLYSELEEKVPFGAWSKLISGLIRGHLERLAKEVEV